MARERWRADRAAPAEAVPTGRAPAIHRHALVELQRLAGNRAVQRLALGGATLGDEIQASCRGGAPLPPAAQRTLESGLGADLGAVRVHADGGADRLARAVQADAFTTGSHIFFRSGSYAPASSAGFERLAHEATHVVQQAAGPVSGTVTADGISLSDPGDRHEREAERTARHLARDHRA